MTASSLFITGASGFIGSNFLRKLDRSKYSKILCLVREPRILVGKGFKLDNLEIVEGDLLNVDAYQAFLKESDIVVHFAALTGKQKPERYFEVNSEGTKILVEKCRELGVRKFLYVSTIAAKFHDKHKYYYAQSKLQAEEIVGKSGLCYTIVRPTQVIGKGGAWWTNLTKIAKAPFTIVFGNGKVKIQPIYLDDLTDCILSICEKEKFDNEIFELGGADHLNLEDFIGKIRRAYGKKPLRPIHIPLKLVSPVVSILEKFFYNLIPISIGQLASFKNDGTADEGKIFMPSSALKNVDEIISLMVKVNEPDSINNNLVHECNLFSSYLIGEKPDEYIVEKYERAHQVLSLKPIDRFDEVVNKFAAIHPLSTRIGDTYCQLFFKKSILRKKLTLLLGILESSAATYHHFEKADDLSKMVLFIRLFRILTLFVLTVFISILLFLPLQLITRLTPGFQKTS